MSGQVKLGSTVQLAEQPSPETLLPSSQASPRLRSSLPSPQKAINVHLVPAVGQV